MPLGIVINANRTVEKINVSDLKGYQTALGGNIEALAIEVDGVPVDMFFNEEGKHLALPANAAATSLAQRCGKLLPGDYIAGAALLLGAPNSDGENTDLPADIVAFVEADPKTIVGATDLTNVDVDAIAAQQEAEANA